MLISKTLLLLAACTAGATPQEAGSTVAASAVPRGAPSNPNSLTVNSKPVLGTELNFTVDVAGTGHTHAQLFATALSANIALGGGQVVLVGGAQLYLSQVIMGPVAVFSGRVPHDLSFAGFRFSMQALHFMGARPFALSNAIDLTAGVE